MRSSNRIESRRVDGSRVLSQKHTDFESSWKWKLYSVFTVSNSANLKPSRVSIHLQLEKIYDEELWMSDGKTSGPSNRTTMRTCYPFPTATHINVMVIHIFHHFTVATSLTLVDFNHTTSVNLMFMHWLLQQYRCSTTLVQLNVVLLLTALYYHLNSSHWGFTIEFHLYYCHFGAKTVRSGRLNQHYTRLAPSDILSDII